MKTATKRPIVDQVGFGEGDNIEMILSNGETLNVRASLCAVAPELLEALKREHSFQCDDKQHVFGKCTVGLLIAKAEGR